VGHAAGDGKWDYHPITNFQFLIVLANLNHFAHGFVTHHVTGFHVGNKAAGQMKIGAADSACRDLDNCVSSVPDDRIRNRVVANVLSAMPTQCAHILDSLEK
jgi:hypothetical protein